MPWLAGIPDLAEAYLAASCDVLLNHGINAGCETETSYLEAAYWKTLPLVTGSAGRRQVLPTRFTGACRPKTTILIVCLQ